MNEENKNKHIEIITSVDAYGEGNHGEHVFHENCILVWGWKTDEHIVLKDAIKIIKEKRDNEEKRKNK